jgi:hypothetical protein
LLRAAGWIAAIKRDVAASVEELREQGAAFEIVRKTVGAFERGFSIALATGSGQG